MSPTLHDFDSVKLRRSLRYLSICWTCALGKCHEFDLGTLKTSWENIKLQVESSKFALLLNNFVESWRISWLGFSSHREINGISIIFKRYASHGSHPISFNVSLIAIISRSFLFLFLTFGFKIDVFLRRFLLVTIICQWWPEMQKQNNFDNFRNK